MVEDVYVENTNVLDSCVYFLSDYNRLDLFDLSRTFFSPPYSVKTTSLPHMPNDLFDQIWHKGVHFGRLVQQFSTPTLQPTEI